MTGRRGAQRLTRALLIGELALTVTLLSGAGVLLRAASALHTADGLVDPSSALTARLSLPASRYGSEASRMQFFQQLRERLDGTPSLASSTFASTVPFIGAPGRQFVLDGQADAAPGTAGLVAAGDGYFETLGLALLRGRAFSGSDGEPGREAAIVNERAASRFFPGQDPIGQRFRLLDPDAGSSTPWLTVVGVSPSIRQSPAGGLGPVVYVPLGIQPPPTLAIIVRSRDFAAAAAQLRHELRAVDQDVALYNIASLERVSQKSRWLPRAMSTGLLTTGVLGLLLSAMGLYGITAYGVAQRTAEIGVRVALGARRSHVRWLVLRGTLLAVGIGLPLGLAGAAAVAQLLRGFLTSANATSGVLPTTIGLVCILLAVIIAATLIPQQRAVRIDPITALRHE